VATGAASKKPSRPSRAIVLALLGAIGVMAGVGVGLLIAAGDEPPPAPPRDVAIGSEPDAAPEPPSRPPPSEPTVEPAPARPRYVRLTVISQPPGATVTVDGEERGVTPIDLSVERRDERLIVEIVRRGYATRTMEVVPERDRELSVELVSNRRGRARRGAASADSPERPEGSPFRRFN